MRRKAWLALALAGSLVFGAVAARRVLKRKGHLGLTSPSSVVARAQRPATLETAELLYEGKLAPGWEDWGWGPHELGKGPARVVFENFGGIVLRHAELSGPYGGVAFRYKAPGGWDEFMQVSLHWAGVPDDAFPTVSVEPRHVVTMPDGWREVWIDWQELDPDGRPFDRLMLSSRSAVNADWVQVDRIMLTKAAPGAAASAKRQAELHVSCSGPSHAISDLIYGGSGDEWATGQSARRIGGNPLSRANWELGAWNVGKDWFFENVAQKPNVFEMVGASAALRRRTALVVPMIGWVAKDTSSVGFPRAAFPQQAQFDQYRAEAGNGLGPDGTPLKPGDPLNTSVPAPPELIEKWVRKLVADDAARGSRGVQIYILDNEPSLWNATHRDVRPEPLSYDELLQRTINYATAIRNADPNALIAGPAEWGWLAYQTSAVDREAGANKKPDRLAHGDVALVPWYLKKLAEREKATGTRLLDVLDLHFYPAAEGVYDNAKTDLAGTELRLRSTRALWDPSYRDESWIGENIQLIPRMKQWVRENYPGRKLMIGEWSFGADEHISGGLAAAEAFGRFGQQGLDAAFFWGAPKQTSPVFWAFRAFRDFDGKGARFEDVSLAVKEADNVSLFASRNEDRSHIVLVVVNRAATATVETKVVLDDCGRVTSSRLFSYGAKSLSLAPGPSELTEAGVAATLEPLSFAVLDLKLEKN